MKSCNPMAMAGHQRRSFITVSLWAWERSSNASSSWKTQRSEVVDWTQLLSTPIVSSYIHHKWATFASVGNSSSSYEAAQKTMVGIGYLCPVMFTRGQSWVPSALISPNTNGNRSSSPISVSRCCKQRIFRQRSSISTQRHPAHQDWSISTAFGDP